MNEQTKECKGINWVRPIFVLNPKMHPVVMSLLCWAVREPAKRLGKCPDCGTRVEALPCIPTGCRGCGLPMYVEI